MLSMCSFAFGQSTYSIFGKVVDDENNAIPYANVLLFNLFDSSFVTGTSSSSDGSFQIKFVANGRYTLRISFIGYNDVSISTVVKSSDQRLPAIQLRQKITNLEMVNIDGEAFAVIQKGDTTEYNANSYKVNPDANVEDLISKMPGITIDNGKVQAAGEDVKKVTIDGEEYFGDDGLIALKNLPSEIVSKIQVFDGQSDQANFTGFMDPNTIKTINIITKNPDTKLTFGKLYAGYGTDDRFNAGGNINYFNGKQKFSLIGTSNNINQQNFTAEDLLGVSAGGLRGGGMSGRPTRAGSGSPFGQSNDDFMVANQDGVNTTNSIGLNYIDRWGTKIKINGSYFFNQVTNDSYTYTNRLYTDSSLEDGYVYSEDDAQNSDNFNHRFKLKLEYIIDSKNTLILTPKLSLQNNKTLGLIDGRNILSTGETNNESITESDNNNNGYSWNGNLLYMHKFNKYGRTLSLNLTNNTGRTKGQNILDYFIFDFIEDSITGERNQLTEVDYLSTTYSANLNITEQLTYKSKLMFSYNPYVNNSKNDDENFLFNNNSSTYDIADSILTNKFSTRIVTHKAGVTFQYFSGKSTLNLGIAYNNNQLTGEYAFLEYEPINKVFHSILPTVMIMHKFSSKSNIRIIIRSGNTLPSILQLQEVLDVSNPLQMYIGNSDLNQDNNRMLLSRYSKTNLDKGRSFFAFLMVQQKSDYIGQSIYFARYDTLVVNDVILPPNTQLVTYNNFNNQLSVRSFFTFGMPVKGLKSNLNLNGGLSYSITPGETNKVLNTAHTTGLNLGLVFSSNISENIDFTLSYNANRNWTKNSVLETNDNNYTIQKGQIKFNYISFNRLIFNTDATLNIYQGLTGLENDVAVLWNLAIGYKWLKEKNLETRFSAFDILNQNIGISRNITPTYVEDVKTNVLNRYFMFTLTYKFNKLI